MCRKNYSNLLGSYKTYKFPSLEHAENYIKDTWSDAWRAGALRAFTWHLSDEKHTCVAITHPTKNVSSFITWCHIRVR
jgi:hypothetical protein